MTFAEYQVLAYSTALYSDKIYYPTLGLVDELSEFIEKRMDDIYNIDETMKEAGDVLWYVAALSTDLGIPLSAFDIEPNRELYVSFGEVDAFIEVGSICGKIKKLFRDKDGLVDDAFRAMMVDKLQKVVTFMVNAICEGNVVDSESPYYYSFERVYSNNIDKLFSRKERGVLKGSGDNR